MARAFCSTLFDCPVCHECSSISGECVPVAAFTDPNGECPKYCDVRTVCNPLHVCVYEERPVCDCDWLTGDCRVEEEEPEEVVVELSITELHARGYSDNDVSMIMAILQQEVEHRHAAQNIVVTEHFADKIILAILGVVVVALLGVVVSHKRLANLLDDNNLRFYKAA